MTCNEVRENLVAYLHGELEKKTVMAIHQHLGRCEECVLEQMELCRTNRLLQRVQYDALPKDFDEKLRRKIQIATPAARILSSNFRRVAVAVAATVVILLGIQLVGLKMLSASRSSFHFNDFPTSQAVFKATLVTPAMGTSLRERLLMQYRAGGETGRLRLERIH